MSIRSSQGIEASVARKRNTHLRPGLVSHFVLDFFLNINEPFDFGDVVFGCLALHVFGEI